MVEEEEEEDGCGGQSTQQGSRGCVCVCVWKGNDKEAVC